MENTPEMTDCDAMNVATVASTSSGMPVPPGPMLKNGFDAAPGSDATTFTLPVSFEKIRARLSQPPAEPLKGLTADEMPTFRVNVTGVFLVVRAFGPAMIEKRRGVVINVASGRALEGAPKGGNYAASKAGIIGFTKSLAQELGSRNVRANVVAPGYITTRLTDVLPDDVRTTMLERTPLARLGQPEDVAGAVRFLCSDAASFITGEVMLVDGGMGM
mgnify:CR=1 FL=1